MVSKNEHKKTKHEEKNLHIPSFPEDAKNLPNISKLKWFYNKNCREWILIVVTGVLAFFTGYMWYETHNLAIQTGISVNIAESNIAFAKQNAHIENRAWVGLAGTPEGDASLINGTINIFIKNFGKTPADSVRIGFKSFFFSNTNPVRPNVILTAPSIISPTEVKEFRINNGIFESDTTTIRKIEQGKYPTVCFYGIVIYKDIDGGKDTTEFMFRYNGGFIPFGINRMK